MVWALSFVALAVIFLMVWDYNERPFDPGNDYTGNPKNSVYLYPVLVTIEFMLVLYTLKVLRGNTGWMIKVLLLIFWCGLTAGAFIDTLRGGGVLAAHALWLSLVTLFLIVVALLNLFSRANTA